MSFERNNATLVEVGVTLFKEITNRLNQSIQVREFFVSQTLPIGETYNNQLGPGLDNKESAAEAHTLTPGSFAGYQLRHGVNFYYARIWDLTD
ncbi:hypothetical protein TNIN_379841 [Trichonephila inaurata madagascariensis]|uniref:Uncharacterized protein n=1 Tax=Trichonephila inaurata madagascariensis TaxID=2747483 RepID=A0A8X7C4U7_9ARAC|nr:hypothetical protein TNIN_379841 [Trichonephila inaurata madagascariensis]